MSYTADSINTESETTELDAVDTINDETSIRDMIEPDATDSDPPVAGSPPPWWRRRVAIIASVVVVLLVSVGGIGGLVWSNAQNETHAAALAKA